MKNTPDLPNSATVQLFSRNWVILNNRELIDQAFVRQGKATVGRMKNAFLNSFCNDKATAFAEGHFWKIQREFDMKCMKSFGKQATQRKILEEFEHFSKYIEDKNGNPCECQTVISLAVANVTLSVLTGIRFPYDDERCKSLAAVAGFNVSGAKDSVQWGILIALPFTRHIPPFKTISDRVVQSYIALRAEMRKIIQERKASFDKNHVRDFVDEFFLEMNKEKADRSFTEEQLEHSLQNLLAASSDTTTNTLRWCIVGMVQYPQHQARIAREVSDMINSRGMISFEYQDELPFTRSYLYEIWRYCTLLPIALPHETRAEMKLQGYSIPKGTPIVGNIWAVHHSPDLFENSHEFRPERFLGDDGQFVSDDNVIPFSTGSRRCYGEHLGRMEAMLFLTKLVENYDIIPEPGAETPKLGDGILAISFAPKKFNVVFRRR